MDRFKLNLATGQRLLDRALCVGIDVEHECGGALACASCCVIVREGSTALRPASDDELDMLERAGVTAETAAGNAPVSLSASAARHFAAQLAKHAGAIAVRLSIEASGCSGFRYRVDPASEILSGDTVFESRGIRIVVDAQSLPRLAGTMLDVAQEGLARRLRFYNPSARQSCGCGESFSA